MKGGTIASDSEGIALPAGAGLRTKLVVGLGAILLDRKF